MNIIKSFENAEKRMQEKNWNCIYVMVDLHGTIFKPSYEKEEKYELYPYAESVLRRLTQDPKVKLILWTSTDYWYLREYLNKLEACGISFDAINANPFEETTKGGVKSMSFKDKPYFNVGLDDKFVFEPETDWELLYNYLKEKFAE